MHRVDEEVRRREEVLERVRRVPAAVPIEANAEGEEIEYDREPEESVGGREVCFLANWLASTRGGRAHVLRNLSGRNGVREVVWSGTASMP
jgi:hypothetical protein